MGTHSQETQTTQQNTQSSRVAICGRGSQPTPRSATTLPQTGPSFLTGIGHLFREPSYKFKIKKLILRNSLSCIIINLNCIPINQIIWGKNYQILFQYHFV